MNRDHRRTQQKRVSKMLMVSKAYIVVLWDGVEKIPTAIMDCQAFTDPDNPTKTPIATSFGEIASFIIGSVKNCIKKADMNTAKLSQAEHAELIKEQRSKQMAAFAGTDQPPATPEPGAPAVPQAEVAPPPAPGPQIDLGGRVLPFRKKESP